MRVNHNKVFITVVSEDYSTSDPETQDRTMRMLRRSLLEFGGIYSVEFIGQDDLPAGAKGAPLATNTMEMVLDDLCFWPTIASFLLQSAIRDVAHCYRLRQGNATIELGESTNLNALNELFVSEAN